MTKTYCYRSKDSILVIGSFQECENARVWHGYSGFYIEDLTSLWCGLYCPKDTADLLVVAMIAHHKSERDRRLAEVWLKNIILYELNNYECHYTGEVKDALETCLYYGATKEQVWGLFKNKNFVI